MWHCHWHRLLLQDCTAQLMKWLLRRHLRAMHLIWVMNFWEARLHSMITRLAALILPLMKSLSVMVPRAIPAISGIFFQLITVLRYVTRFTLFMLIRTLWQAEQGITILQQRDFPMWSICLAQRRMALHRNCRKKHRISFIFAFRITRQAQRFRRQSFRNGWIMPLKRVQWSSMMQLMKPTFQKIMWPIRFMSATVRTDVPSSFEAFPRMQVSQAHVLVSQLFLRRLSAAMWH